MAQHVVVMAPTRLHAVSCRPRGRSGWRKTGRAWPVSFHMTLDSSQSFHYIATINKSSLILENVSLEFSQPELVQVDIHINTNIFSTVLLASLVHFAIAVVTILTLLPKMIITTVITCSLLRTRPDRPWYQPSFIRNEYRRSLSRLKLPGRSVNHLPHLTPK